MRKIFQEDFIRWEEGNNKGQINWKTNEGRFIRFIYDDIQGVIKILDKVSSRRINVMYNNKIIEVSMRSLVDGKIDSVIYSDKVKTIDELKKVLKGYLDEHGRFPTTREIKECSYMPTYQTILYLCKNNNTTLNAVAKEVGVIRKSVKSEYYIYIKIFKETSDKYNDGKPWGCQQLYNNKFGIPSHKWLVDNCPDKKVISYSHLLEWMGYKATYTTREKAEETILEMQNKLDRPLMYDDFRNLQGEEVSISVINRYWGSLNKMKEILGLKIVQENMINKSKTREQLKDDILKYIEKYGDIPRSNDFGKGELMSTSVYYNKFGGIGKAIKECGYKPKKKNDFRDISNEEIIRIYKEAIEKHGVQSTDFYDELELPSTTTCCRRFNCGWDDFLIMLGYKPYDNSYYGYICYADDGTKCLSLREKTIHNCLLKIDGIISIQKEKRYRDFCKGYRGSYRCDWYISYNDKEYIVEYFGLITVEKYKSRHDKKLKIIEENRLMDRLISIYPNDITKIEKVILDKFN